MPKTKFHPTPQQIAKLLQRFTQQELANIFEVNEKTIRRWTKPPKPFQKRGRKPKLNQSSLNFLYFCTTALKVTQQKKLVDYYHYWSDNKVVSQPTICRALKKLGITYKKISYQASEQSREKNQEQIKGFINETLPTLPQSRILFLDECGFHLNSASRYGYSLRGKKVFSQRPGDKGKNYTFIFLAQATNGKKIVHGKTLKGSMKSKDFHEFITSLELPTNERYYLLMDNLSVHRASKSCQKLKLSTIRELLESKNIQPVYLPPYTPELNPAEKCFNTTRQHIETNKPRSKEELDHFIKEKLEFFQKEDLTKYLDNSVRECLAKLDSAESSKYGYWRVIDKIDYEPKLLDLSNLESPKKDGIYLIATLNMKLWALEKYNYESGH